MKITVITVTYNSAKTIVESLVSVAGQSHPDIEHIVVDGGSTDGTLELIAANNERVALLISEPDQGIYDAMNKGLRRATGDMVGFLNSDDSFSSPDVIALLVKHAAERNADAVFGDLVYVDPERTQPLVRYWQAGSFTVAKLRCGWMPPHPTLYVRRTVFDRIGFFDEALRIAADYEFMLRLLTCTELNVIYIPTVLVRMRVGGASNVSLAAMIRKSKEDLTALRRNEVGGLTTLLLKNLRKIPQFVSKPTVQRT